MLSYNDYFVIDKLDWCNENEDDIMDTTTDIIFFLEFLNKKGEQEVVEVPSFDIRVLTETIKTLPPEVNSFRLWRKFVRSAKLAYEPTVHHIYRRGARIGAPAGQLSIFFPNGEAEGLGENCIIHVLW